ncbi:hypothetical protein OE903_20870 [Bacillus sp. B6(2022)]|nr:hypothetical protein [Bacillus sp. B6(2022)]
MKKHHDHCPVCDHPRCNWLDCVAAAVAHRGREKHQQEMRKNDEQLTQLKSEGTDMKDDMDDQKRNCPPSQTS